MPSPTVDIIVPVWNKPFETRACLAAILAHSPEARLIIIANGSNRETELMLEEFSEPLGERGLFISSDRNLGLIKAINMGLSRSDSDYAVIVRPHVEVTSGWLENLLEAAQGGLATPLFRGDTIKVPKIATGCSVIETFSLTFSALAIKGELHMLIGGFNEEMDGAEWCLRDYMRRAWNRGYRTSVSSGSMLTCHPEVVFGSPERRREIELSSSAHYQAHWGINRHFCIYFGKQAEAGSLAVPIDTILDGARRGHTFTLLLHRRQAADFHRIGWDCLHTGITLQKLPMLAPRRDLLKRLASIKAAAPEAIIVQCSADTLLSDSVTPIPLAELSSLWEHTTEL
ncbi:glycosyltransferase family 2 protein [Pelotalea chapellei]|uniref:Glycosyltransferase n=1 Tax=Pelotalea chapellei TaxID=44671 RepID=A0ABS5U4P2_9BACT|nr:glycosyltransferase [Pelotalea chapellei]MBT1070648.1 glycosyltransferase [Pelotalea chapellei]